MHASPSTSRHPVDALPLLSVPIGNHIDLSVSWRLISPIHTPDNLGSESTDSKVLRRSHEALLRGTSRVKYNQLSSWTWVQTYGPTKILPVQSCTRACGTSRADKAPRVWAGQCSVVQELNRGSRSLTYQPCRPVGADDFSNSADRVVEEGWVTPLLNLYRKFRRNNRPSRMRTICYRRP